MASNVYYKYEFVFWVIMLERFYMHSLKEGMQDFKGVIFYDNRALYSIV